jgi:hypothetical protein
LAAELPGFVAEAPVAFADGLHQALVDRHPGDLFPGDIPADQNMHPLTVLDFGWPHGCSVACNSSAASEILRTETESKTDVRPLICGRCCTLLLYRAENLRLRF